MEGPSIICNFLFQGPKVRIVKVPGKVKLLEKNMQNILETMGISKNFLNTSPIAQ